MQAIQDQNLSATQVIQLTQAMFTVSGQARTISSSSSSVYTRQASPTHSTL